MKILESEFKEDIIISDPKSVYSLLSEFKNEDREYFIVLGVNSKKKVIYREIVTIGTLNKTVISPRETFKKAIIMSCNSIIIAHNHPSGDVKPSQDDYNTTKMLKEAGDILEIPILDHIIIGNTDYYSFRSNEEI